MLLKDAFILDTGAGGIFAWLGSGATRQEKKAAFKNAVVSYTLVEYINWVYRTSIKIIVFFPHRTLLSRKAILTGPM